MLTKKTEKTEKIYWKDRPELIIPKNNLGDIVDVLDNKIAFSGNVDLLPVGVKLNYNIHMIQELSKCRDDIIYFAENYYMAQTPKGFQFITLMDYQKKIILELVNNQHYVLMMPRQMGKCIFKDTILNLNNNITNEKCTQSVEELFNECKEEYLQKKS